MAVDLQYWDSCCFLSIINDEPGRAIHLAPLWSEAGGRGKIRILTSSLTIAECSLTKGSSDAREKLDQFFLDGRLTLVGVDRLVGQLARDLQRAVHDRGRTLKPRDAIHLAAALHADADCLLTWDSADLIPLSNLFRTRSGKSLVIEEPRWEGNLPLL